MSFEQAVLVASISLNVVILVGLAILLSALTAFYDKIKQSSELIDSKFAEQDKKLEQVSIMLVTLEMLFTLSNTTEVVNVRPPTPPRKSILTIIKSDDKDPTK